MTVCVCVRLCVMTKFDTKQITAFILVTGNAFVTMDCQLSEKPLQKKTQSFRAFLTVDECFNITGSNGTGRSRSELLRLQLPSMVRLTLPIEWM